MATTAQKYVIDKPIPGTLYVNVCFSRRAAIRYVLAMRLIEWAAWLINLDVEIVTDKAKAVAE